MIRFIELAWPFAASWNVLLIVNLTIMHTNTCRQGGCWVEWFFVLAPTAILALMVAMVKDYHRQSETLVYAPARCR